MLGNDGHIPLDRGGAGVDAGGMGGDTTVILNCYLNNETKLQHRKYSLTGNKKYIMEFRLLAWVFDSTSK